MLKDVFSRLRQQRRSLSIAGHLALVSLAYFAAFALRFDFRIPPEQLRNYAGTLPYLLALRVLLFHRFGLFRGYWHLVGVRDLRQLVWATTLGSLRTIPSPLMQTGVLHVPRSMPMSTLNMPSSLSKITPILLHRLRLEKIPRCATDCRTK